MNEQELMKALRMAMISGALEGIKVNPDDPRWINAANSILANNKELLADAEGDAQTTEELSNLLKFIKGDEEAA